MLQNVSCRSISTLFENSAVKQALKELHKKYVLVPVDKATGNIAIICQIKNLGWIDILAVILTSPMKPVIIFKKIYLLTGIAKIFVIIFFFL